jgi:hypothetical protein
MSAMAMALGMVAIFSTAATTALLITRASREAKIRKEIAADIRARARQLQRFSPHGQFTMGLLTAAAIVEHKPVGSGFATVDGTGRARPAGDWRRSS